VRAKWTTGRAIPVRASRTAVSVQASIPIPLDFDAALELEADGDDGQDDKHFDAGHELVSLTGVGWGDRVCQIG
jgi:hypothetical protein